MAAGILHAVARFVGELAEVHLPRVRGRAQHVDVGAGAEHALAGAGEHDARDFGMLEANALQDVVQLNVNAQVVGVELELVAGLQAAVFVDIHGQRRHAAVNGEPPMAILSGSHVKRDQFLFIYSWHVRSNSPQGSAGRPQANPHMDKCIIVHFRQAA